MKYLHIYQLGSASIEITHIFWHKNPTTNAMSSLYLKEVKTRVL